MSNDPAEILTRVAAAYQACTSYRDEGVVTTTFFGPSRWVQRRSFSTRFVRDQGFLFEVSSQHGEQDRDQYTVWNESGRSRTWWSAKPELDETGSLSMALAGALGFGGRAAIRVPHLLMPELLPKNGVARPPQVAKVLKVPEAEADNCVVIERVRSLDRVEQLWINRSTLLICRVIQPRKLLGTTPPPSPDLIERLKPSYPAAAEMAEQFAERAGRESVETERITVYEAALNPSIRPDELVFTRPG